MSAACAGSAHYSACVVPHGNCHNGRSVAVGTTLDPNSSEASRAPGCTMRFRERLPLLATPSVMYGVGLSSVSNLSAHLPGNAALASHGRGHRFETCHAHQHKRLPGTPLQRLLPANCWSCPALVDTLVRLRVLLIGGGARR